MPGVDGITWSEEMLTTLACHLYDACPHVKAACDKYNHGEEGDLMLSYNVQAQRHDALIRFTKGYYECNFWLDFGGGSPYPCDIEQYKLPCSVFVCGINKELEFITN